METLARPSLQDMGVATQPAAFLPREPRRQNYIDLPGDLAYRPHTDNVQILNNLYPSMERDNAEVEIISQALEAQVQGYRAHVAETYSPELRQSVAGRYGQADEMTTGMTMEDRVKARFETGGKLKVNTDFDGTITCKPEHYLLSHIPGSAHAEPLLAELGRDKFSTVFTKVWREYLKDPVGERAYFDGGRDVELREGVDDLFGYVKELGGEMTVVSANFEPFVMGGLSQIPHADNTMVIAVQENSILSTDKGTVLTDLALEDPEATNIFIGDGSSDIPSLEARDLMACYFALEGSSFARQLAEHDIAHFTYGSFKDIKLKLEELGLKPAEPVIA